jgi:hypothetical protein
MSSDATFATYNTLHTLRRFIDFAPDTAEEHLPQIYSALYVCMYRSTKNVRYLYRSWAARYFPSKFSSKISFENIKSLLDETLISLT